MTSVAFEARRALGGSGGGRRGKASESSFSFAMPAPLLLLGMLLAAALAQLPAAHAVMQTGEISVFLPRPNVVVDADTQPSYTLLASQAWFGSYPKMLPSNNPIRTLALPPRDNPLLCENVTSPKNLLSHQLPAAADEVEMAEDVGGGGGSAMMVPRGGCTFETKAYNAQLLGSRAVIVYGTLASRYSVNETNRTKPYTVDDIVYPLNKNDYDCAYGRADIPADRIVLDDPLPYNSQVNDPLLSGNTSRNLCLLNDERGLRQCPSEACLLTGKRTNGNRSMEACCAWDLHIWLYQDDVAFGNRTPEESVRIPAFYVTIEQGNRLLDDLKRYGSGGGGQQQVRVILSARWRSPYNLSSYLIWALGVFVAALAAYLSAGDYHRLTRRALRKREQQRRAGNGDRASSGRQRRSSPQRRQAPLQEETMELTAWHAVGFIVMASGSLLFLFYFAIYNVVKVMYALGCSKAVSQVVFDPLLRRLMKSAKLHNRIVWRTGTEDFGDITARDILSHVIGYALGIAWLVIAFTVRHPENLTFFWIMQDVFGAAMCIIFLQVIKLNSLNVASILLLVAFFYDIFFVFISPLLFKKSVMITVATSGGPPKADELWCEKYPDDPDCQGGDPLPMLFTIPRINDYQGGSSLLGLGDIVLPGLLLSFAARFDAAKSLLGVLGGGSGTLNSQNCPERRLCGHCGLCSGGYFPPLVVAYGIGLFMANAAVYLMNMGQPALLYLVPCCLGTMAFMGWRRSELKELWHGPKAIRAADDILYGEDESSTPSSGHAPLPTDDGLESPAPSVPSATEEEEEDGGLALLEENTSR